jgi:hypothetical protein
MIFCSKNEISDRSFLTFDLIVYLDVNRIGLINPEKEDIFLHKKKRGLIHVSSVRQ